MRRLIEQLDAEPDPRPWQEPPGDLHETTVEVWEKIAAWSSPIDDHRFLARFGEAIVRLERSGSGVRGTSVLDGKRTINLLARVARWGRTGKLELALLDSSPRCSASRRSWTWPTCRVRRR
jgi:hypothetical protein